MKKLTLLSAVLLVVTVFANAQNEKLSEIGLRFHNLDNFGLQLKNGSHNLLFRYSLSIRTNNYNIVEDDYDQINGDYNLGLGFGLEKRINIYDNFQFIFGPNIELYGSYNSSENKTELPTESISNSYRLSPSLGLIMGFNYIVNNHISITAEIIPSFIYRYTYSLTENTSPIATSKDKTHTNSFGFNLSTSTASITVAYRLFK